MHRNLHSWIIAAGLLGSACANQSHDRTTPNPRTPSAADPSHAAQDEAEARAATRPAVALAAAMHHAKMTEVVPDPRGRAALTLDAEGGVRFWSDLRAQTAPSPLSLPIEEPVWMSLARAKTGWVAGFIDTAGGAQVGRIVIDGRGARWIPTFEIPSTEPLFEMHVLDGGARIVALTVDHRVLLWDAAGTVVSELDRAGFVPWQLRVAQPPGAAPSVVAVLAGPVRVQPLAITGDRIAVTGKAHQVALDRGPNRNDLALTPDGKSVLALMRPAARSPRFELEVIEMSSGRRRILAGDSDLRLRPRMHATDAARVLLESGSGKGFWVDLEAATAWPPAEGEPDRAAIPTISIAPFDLPGSSESTRMHAVTVMDQRLVPTEAGLVVGAIAGAPSRTFGSRELDATAVALDATGERVAWGTSAGIVLEDVEGEAPTRDLASPEDGVALLAFVGGEHLVVMNGKGRASLRRIEGDQDVQTQSIPFSWGISNSAFRMREGGSGELVLSSLKPSEALHVLPVSEGGLGEVRDIPRAQQSDWPEAGKPRNMASRDWTAAIGLPFDELGLRPAEVLFTEPDPTGRRIVIAQKSRHNEGFDQDLEQWKVGPHDFVLTIVDRETRARLWTLPAKGLADLAWSGDGERLAVVSGQGGFVLDASTGTPMLERRDRGLHVVQMDAVASAP